MSGHGIPTRPRFPSLEAVLDYYHIAYNPSKRGEQFIFCPNPAHWDEHPTNCSLNLEKQVLKCFACGVGGGIGTLIQLLEGALSHNGAHAITPAPNGTRPPRPRERRPGATMATFPSAKGLDADWARKSLGWHDASLGGDPVVAIPYCDWEGHPLPLRYRVGIDASGPRFEWQTGLRVRGGSHPYGLLNWEAIKKQSYAILAEGETNVASLIFHGYMALGIPGAGNYKDTWNPYLKGIEWLYLWQDPDAAGEKLAAQLKSKLPHLRVIKAPPGVKDPNELLQQSNGQFQAEFEKLLDLADAQFDASPKVPAPEDSGVVSIAETPETTPEFDPGNERRSQGKGDRPFFLHLSSLVNHPLNIKMRERQKRLIRSARLLYTEEADKWCDSIEGCISSVRAQYHHIIKAIALVPMHCGDRACVPDIWHNVEQFFQKRAKLLQEHLPNPVVYLVEGIKSTIPDEDDADTDGGIKSIVATETQIRKAIMHMANYEGSDLGWKTAQNFVDSITPTLVNNELSFSVAILADVEPNALQMLQERFSKEFGAAVRVKIASWGSDLVGASDMFISESAINFDADGAANYFRLRKGLKRKKLFQGHGALASMTMSRGSKKEKSGSKSEGCKICGVKHKKIEQLVPITKAKGVLTKSPTGQFYYRAINTDDPIYDALRRDIAAEEERQQRHAADREVLKRMGKEHLLSDLPD